MEPTGNSTVSGERKPIKKTVATSATAKPNGKSTASSATVGAVKPEDSSASGVNQKPSPPVGSPAQVPLIMVYSLWVKCLFFSDCVDNGFFFKSILGSVVLAQTSPGASSVRSVPSTSVKKKPDVVPARQTTSISSRDDSDDDDLDGDMETADNGDPTDVKRARRYNS
ncbi:unnamed protein product [Brassica rapa]|uniref:Uncharacterized protein n=1 Tax=Brassica campestris TaxID=3711 RepID=A0A8D9G1W6_BRACM|nr:unnamed protein product [Brassica rapa]